MTCQDSPFRRLLERFDPFDEECGDYFFEVADELREHCAAVHSDAHGGFWVVTRFEDVQKGFADEKGLSTVPTTTIPSTTGAIPLIPLQCEPEVHGDFRRLLDPYFRAGAVAKYESPIRSIVSSLIDGFIERGRCEFIAEFARPLPGAVIFQLFLGLPASQLDEAFGLILGIMHDLDKDKASLVHRDFMRLVADLLEQRRAEAPRDDVVNALLQGTVSGRPLTPDEILRTLMHLIAAGLDTTYHSLGNIIVTLIRHPDLCRRLEEDPALIPDAIEEILRWEPVAGGLVRTAKRSMALGDAEISEGDRVLLLVASANRDPRQFDDPAEIDLARQARNLSFGYGAHYCLGVHLARLELRVALEELLSRLHDLKLEGTGVAYDSGCSRGPSEVQLSFLPSLASTAT
jgi:cytochrome P450